MNWSAADFFSRLTSVNKFAQDNGFSFHPVSGLEGFHSTISGALKAKAMVCVCDSSEGSMRLDNSPHTSRVKTVFLFMRHKVGDDAARNRCMDVMRELFRQFMSVLVQERVRLEEDCIYLDSDVSFTEVDKYFFTEGACAFFQITVDRYVDIDFRPEEWLANPLIRN